MPTNALIEITRVVKYPTAFDVTPAEPTIPGTRQVTMRKEVLEYQHGGQYMEIPIIVGKPRKPTNKAVLILHEHASNYYEGGNKNWKGDYPIARALTEMGFTTFSPDAICFGARTKMSIDEVKQIDYDPVNTGRFFEIFVAGTENMHGGSMSGLMLSEVGCMLKHIKGRGYDSIGVVGHSLGGFESIFSAALYDQVSWGLSSCGFSSFKTIEEKRITHSQFMYMPGFFDHFSDYSDILKIVGDRGIPFAIVSGTEDAILPYSGVKVAQQELDGFKNLHWVTFEGKHGINKDAWVSAYHKLGM